MSEGARPGIIKYEDGGPQGPCQQHDLYGDGEMNWCEWCDYSETVDQQDS